MDLEKGDGWLGNRGINRNHPIYNVIKIDENTEKGPVELRRLVPQTPVKVNQLSLLAKKILSRKTGGLRNNRTNWDYPNRSIVKIGQNTAKSPGDLKRHAVIQKVM